MVLLLDTHAVIWFSENSNNLSIKAKNLIQDGSNKCLISIASIWEMAIKLNLKKLHLEMTLSDFINELVIRDFSLMSIKLEHVIKISDLAYHHNDPFDRLLISQSIIEKIPIISKDSVFEKYGIDRIW